MNLSTTNWLLRSTKEKPSKLIWLSYLGLILIISLSLAACQKQPADIPNSISPTTSPTGNLTQQTAEIWLDSNTLEVVVNPTKIEDNLSGITVRVKIQPNHAFNSIDLTRIPFTLSESLLESGWAIAVNLITETPEGEIWADLALINTQPKGIALTDLTTIATLNPLIINNVAITDLTPVIDLNMTKIMTKSAQEVEVSIPNEMSSP